MGDRVLIPMFYRVAENAELPGLTSKYHWNMHDAGMYEIIYGHNANQHIEVIFAAFQGIVAFSRNILACISS